MEEFRAKSAAEFLHLLRPSQATWLSGGVLYSNWGFRGQGDASWRLVPSAWRPECQAYFQSGLKWAKKNYAKPRLPARAQDVLHHLLAEQHAVDQFADIADRVGLTIPDLEELNEQQLESLPYLSAEGKKFKPHKAVALAQHHGVPTQLLDFTYHGLIAAFFAAESAYSIQNTNSNPNQQNDLAVWAVNYFRLDDGGYLERVHYPRSMSQYLHAQDGFFLYRPRAYEHYVSHGEWPTLDSIVLEAEEQTKQKLMFKLLLPCTEAKELLRLLWAEGYYREA